MKKPVPILAGLTAAVFFTSCSVYKFQDVPPSNLASKGGKAKIVSVDTESESVVFLTKRPARVNAGAVVGMASETVEIDPADIADAVRYKTGAKVVMKGGARYQVVSGVPSDDKFVCEVLRPVQIPLEDVRRVSVRKADSDKTAVKILTFVAIPVLLILGAMAGGPDDEEGEATEDALIGEFFDALFTSGGKPKPAKSVACLFPPGGSMRVADEMAFWVTQWTVLGDVTETGGKYEVRIGNGSDVPRGVDEARLIVVDHPAGLVTAPDILGFFHTLSDPGPPSVARDREGRDILPLLAAKDGLFWRTRDEDREPGGKGKITKAKPRDEIVLEFPKPAGARWAKLVVNATNSTWRSEYARRELDAAGGVISGRKKDRFVREAEFAKLRVEIETVSGWQTGQVIFGGGPLSPEDTVYPMDLSDVSGGVLRIRLTPPAGYWLIDRLAVDYGLDEAFKEDWMAPEETIDLNGDEVLQALAEVDGKALLFEGREDFTVLRFVAPPLGEGLVRSLFLRTVGCYEMPPLVPDKKGS